MYGVIEARVEVCENEKCCWNTSRQAERLRITVERIVCTEIFYSFRTTDLLTAVHNSTGM